MGEPATNITELLKDFSQGDRQALEKLLPKVYEELHQRAEAYMRRERPGHTLQPTALISEVFMRLAEAKQLTFENRTHFFAIAANMMRRILVNHAVKRKAQKRGGNQIAISFDETIHWQDKSDPDLIALDHALEHLEKVDQRQAKVVELRYFAGLSIEESATALNISPATVKRDWDKARVWLIRELRRGEEA